MKQSKATPETLARLKAALQRRGITQEQVAAEAKKTSRRPSVSHTTVSNVLAGRRKSGNVVAAAKRLLAAARQQSNGKVTAA